VQSRDAVQRETSQTRARKGREYPALGVMDAELNAYDALGLSFESNPDDATIRKVRRRERDASSFFHCISFVDCSRAVRSRVEETDERIDDDHAIGCDRRLESWR